MLPVAGGLLAVILGCESDAQPGLAFATRDSAGVGIAESWGYPSREERWSVQARPEVSIGGSQRSPSGFEVVTQATRLGDGRIVVLENGTAELRFFSARGQHLATTQLQSADRGAFDGASTFVRLAGDSLLVDVGDRHMLVDPEGNIVRERWVIQFLVRTRGTHCPATLLADGTFLVCQTASAEDGVGGVSGPMAQILRVAPDSSDVLLGHFAETTQLEESTWIASGGSPPILAIVRNPDYSVEVKGLDGRVIRIFRMVPPIDQPTAFGLTVGVNGDIWVRRAPSDPTPAETVFDVFDRDGRFRGGMRFDGYFWLYEVGEDYVLGAHLDRGQVPHIRLHRLSRG